MDDSILQELRELVDEDYRKQFLKDYPQQARPVLGVPPGNLHELAREKVCNKDWRKIVDKELSGQTFEEVLLGALIVGFSQLEEAEALKRMAFFMKEIDSEKLCDAICLAFHVVLAYPDATLTFLKPYINSREGFKPRFAIVILLDYYVTSDVIDKVLELYAQVTPFSTSALSALAWGYQVCFLAYPYKTHDALPTSSLSDENFQLVLNHIASSPRITQPLSELLEALRR